VWLFRSRVARPRRLLEARVALDYRDRSASPRGEELKSILSAGTAKSSSSCCARWSRATVPEAPFGPFRPHRDVERRAE
jgi:hypothetical protein